MIVWLHTLINASLCYVSVSLPTYSSHQPWQEWENALLFHSLCCFGKYRWPFIHDTWRLGSTTVIVQLANRPYTKAQKRKRAQKTMSLAQTLNYIKSLHCGFNEKHAQKNRHQNRKTSSIQTRACVGSVAQLHEWLHVALVYRVVRRKVMPTDSHNYWTMVSDSIQSHDVVDKTWKEKRTYKTGNERWK